MRRDCKNYESRTYPSGDTVRMCRKDLAPEAPWRCPDECPGYQRKVMDGGWVHGSLTPDQPEDEPNLDDGAVSMLDQAEDIVNAAGPGIISSVNQEREAQRKAARSKKRRWWPFGKGA